MDDIILGIKVPYYPNIAVETTSVTILNFFS